MQAYSRSIQPADDPERLFGERPHRRYRITEQSDGGSNNSNCGIFTVASTFHNVGAFGNCSIEPSIVANDLNLVASSIYQHGY